MISCKQPTTAHNFKHPHRLVSRICTPITQASTMAATMLTTATASAQLAPISSFSRFQGAARTRLAARRMVCRAAPSKGSSGPAINAGDKVTEKIEDAQEICAGDTQSEDCTTAWNEVEAEKAKKKNDKGDPLEDFCEDNPETDECRTYTD